MLRNAESMRPDTMRTATENAQKAIQDAIEYANALTTDPDAAHRKSECLCQVCYYRSKRYSRVAGAACTSRACMCCHAVMHFPSTATDVLCGTCARETDLCRRCGADMNLQDRIVWPSPKPQESTDEQEY